MPNITQKAIVTQVPIGTLQIEGLMLEDGSYAVAQQQVASLFGLTTNHVTRDLKAILGAGSGLTKVSTNRNTGDAKNATEVALNLVQFQIVIVKLSAKGHLFALELNLALVGLALTQLFSDAFGVKFEKEERQRHLLALQTHREQFRVKFTDWLKEDGEKFSLTVNYGAEVNKLKTSANLPLTHLHDYKPEDYPIMEELNRTYHSYSMLRLAGKTHDETIALITLASTK